MKNPDFEYTHEVYLNDLYMSRFKLGKHNIRLHTNPFGIEYADEWEYLYYTLLTDCLMSAYKARQNLDPTFNDKQKEAYIFNAIEFSIRTNLMRYYRHKTTEKYKIEHSTLSLNLVYNEDEEADTTLEKFIACYDTIEEEIDFALEFDKFMQILAEILKTYKKNERKILIQVLRAYLSEANNEK